MSVKSGSTKVLFSAILPACGPMVTPQNVIGIRLVLQPLLQPRHWWSLLLQARCLLSRNCQDLSIAEVFIPQLVWL